MKDANNYEDAFFSGISFPYEIINNSYDFIENPAKKSLAVGSRIARQIREQGEIGRTGARNHWQNDSYWGSLRAMCSWKRRILALESYIIVSSDVPAHTMITAFL